MTLKSLKKTLSKLWKKVTTLIDMHPMISFFGFLGLLLVLVILGSALRKAPAVEKKQVPEPQLIETYSFGQSPRVTLTAKIEKAGVIQVYAQVPGIVQKLNVTEGAHIGRGTTLVSLSSTYAGANSASLTRQLAQKNYDFATQNFDSQIDLINRQRDLANKNETMSSQMREITKQSLDDTRGLIDLNTDIISSLDSQISSLESTNVGGSNDSAILGAKQGKAGAQAGLNQLTSTLRSLEYQSDEEKIPAGLPTASRDLTLRQLDLQEKSLALSKEISELNLKLARVGESLMYPSTPCTGTVERLYVKVGQNVSPGTLVATISADKGEVNAVVLTTAEIARQVSRTDESIFLIGGKKIGLLPRYVSKEATDGNLYSILYSIPSTSAGVLTNTDSIPVDVVFGSAKIVTDEMYIPLDSIYQTQEKSYVYVVTGEKGNGEEASVKEITLGEVSGSFVEVIAGLSSTDTVILSRTVQEGERIRTE